ncbi:MAG: bifunctional oligoribonuclease/PAP phosphatase NrnA [Cytophagales bacterium]
MSVSQILEAAKIKEFIAIPKNVVITTHHKPDADALGSSLALYHFLKKLNHEVTIISPSDYPKFLFWMPGEKNVVTFDAANPKPCEEILSKADVVFCLDFNSLSRVNELESLLRANTAPKVIVDHHLQPEEFAQMWYWRNTAAATCELIYELIIEMQYGHLLDVEIGECLYAGIMTDTGSFRFPSTTSGVHRIIADLIDLGVDNAKVHQAVYDSNSENRLKFIGYSLYHCLHILPQYKTAYFVVPSDVLEKFSSQTGDTEGLVNYALSLDNVIFAAIIVERPDMVKMSFRSKGTFSARDFASEHFDGGGHKNAAGGKSVLGIKGTEEKFVKLLETYKNTLNNSNE